MVAVAAGLHLRGIGPIGLLVICFVPRHELQKEAGCGSPGGDVRRSQAIGGQAAHVTGTFQQQYPLSLTGSRYGRGNAARRTAHHNHIPLRPQREAYEESKQ